MRKRRRAESFAMTITVVAIGFRLAELCLKDMDAECLFQPIKMGSVSMSQFRPVFEKEAVFAKIEGRMAGVCPVGGSSPFQIPILPPALLVLFIHLLTLFLTSTTKVAWRITW